MSTGGVGGEEFVLCKWRCGLSIIQCIIKDVKKTTTYS